MLNKENIGSIVADLRENSRPANEILSQLSPDIQLLCLGETHDFNCRMRKFCNHILQDWSEQLNITDIALEFPVGKQADLNQFMNGELAEEELILSLGHLLNAYDDSDGEFKVDPNFLQVLKTARDRGVRLHAVDRDYDNREKSRDEHMSTRIKEVLSGTDNRVLFYVGFTHLISRNTQFNDVPTAAEALAGVNYWTLVEIPWITGSEEEFRIFVVNDSSQATCIVMEQHPRCQHGGCDTSLYNDGWICKNRLETAESIRSSGNDRNEEQFFDQLEEATCAEDPLMKIQLRAFHSVLI